MSRTEIDISEKETLEYLVYGENIANQISQQLTQSMGNTHKMGITQYSAAVMLLYKLIDKLVQDLNWEQWQMDKFCRSMDANIIRYNEKHGKVCKCGNCQKLN